MPADSDVRAVLPALQFTHGANLRVAERAVIDLLDEWEIFTGLDGMSRIVSCAFRARPAPSTLYVRRLLHRTFR